MVKLTTEQFIERAKKIFGDTYDYSCSKYEHSLSPISVICKKHGRFEIRPSNHINNKQGCWKCGDEETRKKLRKNGEEFLKDVKKRVGWENFDFSESLDFKTRKDPIKAKCLTHGTYETTPRDILRSDFFGCAGCRSTMRTKKEFSEMASKIHNNEYIYDKVDYKGAHEEVTVICKIHGDFIVKPYLHTKGKSPCKKCHGFSSSYERNIYGFLSDLGVDDLQPNYRKLDGVFEVDLFSEERKIAIEINGLYYHSEILKDKFYHLNKTKQLNHLGYDLVHIFEDELLNKKEICLSILKNKFNLVKDKIHARKCLIKELSSKESRTFLEKNHIQGFIGAKVHLGLIFNGEIVSVMTLGSNRICLKSKPKEGEWEMYRFANKLDTVIIGGANKLFKFFEGKFLPNKVTTYCDRRWFTGNVYKKMGFNLEAETAINYFYTRGSSRVNRFNFRKSKLVKEGFSEEKTEKQIMLERGYHRIYDCGNFKFTKQY